MLPLECTESTLLSLLPPVQAPGTDWAARFENYCIDAIRWGFDSDQGPVGITNLDELATFSAYLALRVEFADPIVDSHLFKKFPEGSAERRMMTTPLRKHPGLTPVHRDIRSYYIQTVRHAFLNYLPEQLQNELVGVLVAPGPEDGTLSDPRKPPRTIDRECVSQPPANQYAERITQHNNHFEIPLSHATRRCLVDPPSDHRPFEIAEELPLLKIRDDSILIPEDIVLAKLSNYAWHAWYKLGPCLDA